MEEIFVVGYFDDKNKFGEIFDLSKYKNARKVYNKLCKESIKYKINPLDVFIFPFPPDDEVVEKFKLTKNFLQWLNIETNQFIKHEKN